MRISDLLGDGEEGVDPPDDRRYDDAGAAPQDIARSQFAQWQAGAPAEAPVPAATEPPATEPPAHSLKPVGSVFPVVIPPAAGEPVQPDPIQLGVPADDLLPYRGSRKARRGR